jgi:hypothetical protein
MTRELRVSRVCHRTTRRHDETRGQSIVQAVSSRLESLQFVAYTTTPAAHPITASWCRCQRLRHMCVQQTDDVSCCSDSTAGDTRRCRVDGHAAGCLRVWHTVRLRVHHCSTRACKACFDDRHLQDIDAHAITTPVRECGTTSTITHTNELAIECRASRMMVGAFGRAFNTSAAVAVGGAAANTSRTAATRISRIRTGRCPVSLPVLTNLRVNATVSACQRARPTQYHASDNTQLDSNNA